MMQESNVGSITNIAPVKLYMSKRNQQLCGLNVLRNLFGYDIVNISDMNMAIDKFTNDSHNLASKIYGIHNVGPLHLQVVQFLFQKYGKFELTRVDKVNKGIHISDGVRIMQSNKVNYVVYGWDMTMKTKNNGHFLLVKQGQIIDDAYHKDGIVRVSKLDEDALALSLYGTNTTLKVYEIIPCQCKKVKHFF